jgi:hypothetical protein
MYPQQASQSWRMTPSSFSGVNAQIREVAQYPGEQSTLDPAFTAA